MKASTLLQKPVGSQRTCHSHKGYAASRPIAAIALLVFLSQSALAYTPTDPVVSKMVDRGVQWLETEAKGSNTGEIILTGYAHMKCRHDPEHPVVKKGVAEALNYAAGVASGRNAHEHKRNYEISVAVLLLAEVDPDRYRSELETLQHSLFEEQLPNGGFGYPGESRGDISQTQYAILAIWTLDRVGIPLDYAKVVACAQWLMRVQDVSGAWPYKGDDPGPGNPIKQQKEKVGYSMALAGGSSLLIAGDALRLWGDTVDKTDPAVPGLPEAIQLYKEDTNKNRRRKVKLSQEPLKRSVAFMEQWKAKNPYERQGFDWFYYILYTRERFESFVEIANGRPKDKSPAWYNEGVDLLRKSQGATGGWDDRTKSPPTASTALALLFLIRSTQKAIFNIGESSLGGGRSLPKNTTNIQVDGTQITGQAIATRVTDMLSILEEDGSDDVEGKSIPDNLELATSPVARKAQLDRLERLVRGSRSYQARRVAAKLLGKSDELRVAPALIYALSDPDRSTRDYARDGLRFISRKFDGYGLPPRPADFDDQSAMNRWRQEVNKVQNKWRDWYRTIDPTYVFLDYDL